MHLTSLLKAPKLLIVLAAAAICLAISPAGADDYYYTDQSPNGIDFSTTNVGPGDTVYLVPHTRTWVSFMNLVGTAENPITITNYGGQFHAHDTTNTHETFRLIDCQHVILQGTPGEGYDYGIKISNEVLKTGLDIQVTPSDIEICGVEIGPVGSSGIKAKDEAATPPDVFNNLRIHDCYIHDTGNEGMYLGSSNFTSGTEEPLYNCHVYNNYVENNGWDAIQVGCGTVGTKIYNNVCINYGTDGNKLVQNDGIRGNPGFAGEIYNNWIEGNDPDSQVGIHINPYDDTYIYNNVIVTSGGSGIGIGDDKVILSGTTIYIANNTIIQPDEDGIQFRSLTAENSLAINNIVVDPGDNYLNRRYAAVDITEVTNLYEDAVGDVGFTDAANDDYSLSSSATGAIDQGTDVSSYGVTFDFDGESRPYNTYYDIGAFEYQGGTPTNQAPSVDAGSDASITLPTDEVSLDATVTDDGLPDPPASFTVEWTKQSGPGTVTFDDDEAVDTDATFSAAGTYVLRLTADDGALTAYDEVTITVNSAPVSGDEFVYDGFDTPGDYTNGYDLATQTGGGSGDWTSNWSDIQSNAALSTVSSSLTYTGLTTTDGSVSSPTSSRVHYIRQFTNDQDLFAADGEVWFSALFNRTSGSSNFGITIAASSSETLGCGFRVNNSSTDVQASINGTTGTTNANTDFSNSETVFVVGRISIDAGDTSGDHVVDIWVNPSTTTDLSSAALKSGDSWVDRSYAGFEGSDRVNVYCHENNAIVYDEIRVGATWADVVPAPNAAPSVDAGNNASITLPTDEVSLDATVTDDGLPNPPGAFTVEWTKQSGPGTVTFDDDEAVDTDATFSAAGTYVLRLTADDGDLTAYDEVTITVNAAPSNEFVYDGFETPGDYTNGYDLATQTGGGSGDWTSNWSDALSNAALSTVSSSLAYTGLTTTDGSVSSPTSSRVHYVRQFTNDQDLFAADGEVWFSVLFNRTSGSSNFGITLAAVDSQYIGCGFRVNNSSTDVQASINGTTGTTNANTDFSNNETVLVIGRVSIDAGDTSGDHVVDIWVNPSTATDLSSAALKSGDSWVDRSYSSFEISDRVNVYCHENNAIVYDEIRVGATWADVVP